MNLLCIPFYFCSCMLTLVLDGSIMRKTQWRYDCYANGTMSDVLTFNDWRDVFYFSCKFTSQNDKRHRSHNVWSKHKQVLIVNELVVKIAFFHFSLYSFVSYWNSYWLYKYHTYSTIYVFFNHDCNNRGID